MAKAHPISTHHRFQNLTGKCFGRLTVVSYAGQKHNSLWNCRCDCGKKSVVYGNNLKRATREVAAVWMWSPP